MDPALERQRDRLRGQLTDELSANPTMGELSAHAEALTAARELAAEQPELAVGLVPAVAQAVLAVTPATHRKGRSVLLGRFDATIRRDGMAMLADATTDLTTGAATEHATAALRAASSVLEHASDRSAMRHALRTVGAVAAARPDAVADHLNRAASAGTVDSTSLCPTVETLLSNGDRTRLRQTLRAVALLAVDDSTRPLIDGLPPTVFPASDYGEGPGERAYRVQAWASICRRELGHEPNDTLGRLWSDLERGIGVSREDAGTGIVWWLLADYAGGDLPADTDRRLATVVQRDHARDAITDAVALPDSLVDTRRLVHGAVHALDDPDAERRIEAARALVSLVGTPAMSTPLLWRVVETLVDPLDDPDLLPLNGVVGELATLAESASVSTSLRRRAVDALTRALDIDHDGMRWAAAQELGAKLAAPVVGRSHRTSAVETLEQVLRREPGSLTDPLLVELAAKQLAAIAGDESLSDPVRERAADALLGTLTYDEHADADHIRGLATEQVTQLLGTGVLSTDRHGRLYDSLVAMLDGFLPDLGERGAEGLGTLATTPTVRRSLRQRAVEALVDAVEDTSEHPLEGVGLRTRVSAALELAGLAETDLVTSDELESARETLTDVDGAGWPVRETAVDGLGELVASDAVPAALRERALADLVAVLQSVTGLARGKDVRRKAAKRLATAAGYGTVSEETGLSVLAALSAVLDDPQGRAPAALGIANICRADPELASRLDRERIEQFGRELSPETPTPTGNLLSALDVVAEASPSVVSPVRDDLQRLRSDDAPPSVQIQALEVRSRLDQRSE
jgi:hypothetical protein